MGAKALQLTARELYELDFGGGHKVFTFVIWAEGEERGRGK